MVSTMDASTQPWPTPTMKRVAHSAGSAPDAPPAASASGAATVAALHNTTPPSSSQRALTALTRRPAGSWLRTNPWKKADWTMPAVPWSQPICAAMGMMPMAMSTRAICDSVEAASRPNSTRRSAGQRCSPSRSDSFHSHSVTPNIPVEMARLTTLISRLSSMPSPFRSYLRTASAPAAISSSDSRPDLSRSNTCACSLTSRSATARAFRDACCCCSRCCLLCCCCC
mmetsp:Transcript_13778/g.39931  ORF Transcript_13778/g.39931 Transcript_13778/m.39931 type:complete len:227 (+) Transcript_13778:1428-2108(+)